MQGPLPMQSPLPMRSPLNVALKEWAVVCLALESAHSIALARKGGIREPRQGFTVDHQRFLLYPTWAHAAPDELAPDVRPLLDQARAAAPPAGRLVLSLAATVVATWELAATEQLAALEGAQPLASETLARRFRYRRPGLHVIALRVERLARPAELPSLFRYDGCRSWVELDSPVETAEAEPVLDDAAFSRRLAALEARLGQPLPRATG